LRRCFTRVQPGGGAKEECCVDGSDLRVHWILVWFSNG
jgi:hypothetical protein